MWDVIGAIAGPVIGGLFGSSAASSAADAQAGAAAASDATQRYMYDTTRADAAPYREAGYNALARIAAGLQPGGAFSRRFSAADMQADPVYQSGLQFGLDEGVKGLNRQAAATGNLLSGATLKALTRFGNDYASTKANDSFNRFQTETGNQFNRNASIAGVGQTANNQVAAAGQNMANNISNTAVGLGNARAASAIGRANAWTSAINGGMNYYQGNQLLNALRSGGGNNAYNSMYNGGYNFDNGNMIDVLRG